MLRRWNRRAALCSIVLRGAPSVLGMSCGEGDATLVVSWSEVLSSPGAALLSVSGTSADDVWMVGADGGDGPLMLHWDGVGWERRASELRGDLWWVQALPNGAVYMGGANAHVLRHGTGVMERFPTPGLAKQIVFGVWASSEDDVYAVGSAQGRNGFIWHAANGSWMDLPLPADLPVDENADVPGFFKVWGSSAADVWVVGDRGVVLRGNAADGFSVVPSGTDERLFTVAGAAGRVAMVGGSGNGLALEEGPGGLRSITPPGSGMLQGVSVTESGAVWTVGAGANVHVRATPGAAWRDIAPRLPVQSLHAVWVDPEGGAWTVGGNVLTSDLDAGVALHYRRGSHVSPLAVPRAEPPAAVCPELASLEARSAASREVSVARLWNEQLSSALRQELPRPPVHARELFRLSVALWDVWAAYDTVADGVVVSERASALDVPSALDEALSYAAYRVLGQRQGRVAATQACFDALMRGLGYDPGITNVVGDTPAAVGNRIGSAVFEAFAADGSNEANDYADPANYAPDNPRLVVDLPGTRARHPLLWQELELSDPVTPNGISLEQSVQMYVAAHWGQVLPFALLRVSGEAPYVDVGPPPAAVDGPLLAAVVEVIARSAELDAADGVEEEVTPGASAGGSVTSTGAPAMTNPITGEPYPRERHRRGDFRRVTAEYWAHGPSAETPPGHWNLLANAVSEHASFARRLLGGRALDPLAWDVHLYLALNGAEHDAAVATWELKRRYVSARPITLIRYLAGLGQRTLPDGPAYHPDGLPLVDGLIEVITDESAAPGARHGHLARYVGEIAIRSWRGEPGDRARQSGGVAFQRGKDWVPYERRSFVTPAFPAYVSEQSSLSRAAAVVLHRMTGSAFFPGGLASHPAAPGALGIELGPSEPIELRWATYYDAANQAGEAAITSGHASRLDDSDGRRVGEEAGQRAVARAARYFDGSARP